MAARKPANTIAEANIELAVEPEIDLDAVDYFALALDAFTSAYELAHAKGEAPQGITAGLDAAAEYLAKYVAAKGA